MARGALIEERELASLIQLGLAWERGDRIGITGKGMPLLDAVLPRLVADGLVSA
jgi:hypothetical protein